MKKIFFTLLLFTGVAFSCNDPATSTAEKQSLLNNNNNTEDPGFELINNDTAALMIQHFKDTGTPVNHSATGTIQQINLLRADLKNLVSDSNTAEINFFMAAYLPADTTHFESGITSRANKQTVLIRLKKYTNNNADSVYEYYDARNPTNIPRAQRPGAPICPEPPCQ